MLEIRDLSFSAGGKDGREILKNISETFDSGKLYVLTGPNGGGKSTLAKLLMGTERPDSGAILLDGRDITALGVSERARLGIGYSFQTSPRFKGIKVGKLLSLAMGEGALGEGEAEGKAGELLRRVGLEPSEYLDRDADGGLSGGEMKRIEIATVLARSLRLAIFDEPRGRHRSLELQAARRDLQGSPRAARPHPPHHLPPGAHPAPRRRGSRPRRGKDCLEGKRRGLSLRHRRAGADGGGGPCLRKSTAASSRR